MSLGSSSSQSHSPQVRAKAKAKQTSCMNNMRQIGIAGVMYVGDNNAYPGCLSTPAGGSPNYYYVWPTRLFSLMGGNRKAFTCPAAAPWTAWDTNLNVNSAGKSTLGGMGPVGVYDPYAIVNTSFFGLGYNDWGSIFKGVRNRSPGLNWVWVGTLTEGWLKDGLRIAT
jgi:hypothetical protein